MLFADLVGSTALASSEDPEQTRVLLDRFYDVMAEEIEATGGTIEKFAGDAVMAVFGVPVAREDHAERALHTALAMRSRIHELFGARLQLRIGVNTGEIVAGTPRVGSSFVSGDPVNVTARLEQGAAPGEIVVGERTAALAGAAFDFSEPLTIEAKGKEGGIPARRLLDGHAPARPRGALGDAFVGRRHELDSLIAVFDQVVERASPAIVTIVGHPGVGKSRLLAELSSTIGGRDPRPTERTGRCLSYGRGLTYRPLAEVLRQELRLLDSDQPARALELLGDRAILGLALGLDVTGDLHPLVVREHFQQAWIGLLDELVARTPGVLVIEDIHWAEEPLLELLRAIRHRVAGPLLLLFDVLGGEQHDSLPGAIWLPGAGRGNGFDDAVQAQLARLLQAATKGDVGRAMVFFCQGTACWLSYNAALRAVALGYREVYWYRGGLEAWIAAGGALAPLRLSWRKPAP